MICPQCGGPMSDGSQFCSSCGWSAAGQTDSSPPAETSGKAIASLVFGIIPLSILSSIPAVTLGHLALSEIRKQPARLGGKGMAMAGLILGYIGVALLPLTLILAAIALPNLLRARIAANESSAVNSIRAIMFAQANYQASYPEIGFAPSLDALGSGTPTCVAATSTNACLIDYRLTSASTPPGKNGYIFAVRNTNGGKGYLVSAEPVSRSQTGVRSFCSSEDTVVHVNLSGGSIADPKACDALPTLE